MPFVYYVPESFHSSDRETFDRFGISHAFDDADAICRPCMSGPDGNLGTVIGRSSLRGGIGYFKERQTWQPIGKSGAFVGWPTQGKPGPADLARTEQLAGKAVRLADGREWLVPIARRPLELPDGTISATCALPRTIQHDGTQWTLGSVVARYEHLWQLAEETWSSLGEESTTLMVQLDAASDCLAANYFLGPVECGILGLFESGSHHVWNVVRTLIDFDGWETLVQKKTDQGVGNSMLGEPV